MKNCHTLISGRTGSGKSTLAKALLGLTARAIVLDVKHEYEGEHYITVYDLDEFARELLARRWQPFLISFRASQESDYGRAMDLARHIQQVEPHGPLVLVLEEAALYGSANNIDESVRQLYHSGRHERISMLTILQVDTDFHRIARYGSELIVTLYQHKLSGDLASLFRLPDVMALRSLKDDYTEWPEQFRHFLVHPEGTDLYSEWAEAHNYILVPP